MISLILPTYNESENIASLIEALSSCLGHESFEIIVVDDDSADLTWKVVSDMHKPNVRAIRRINEKGLAGALASGLKEARGDIVGWMDADMSMPASLMPKLIEALGSFDIAIGSRYVQGGSDRRSFLRVLTSRLINGFAGLLLGLQIKDYDSGFILLKSAVFEKVHFPAQGHGEYFIEFVFKAKRAGFKIKEVPYAFCDRSRGKSKTAASPLVFLRLGLGYIARIIALRLKGTVPPN